MTDCTTCKSKTPASVPYIVYEASTARVERFAKRLWITIIILIALLVGTNGAWLWYESQFEDTIITQEVTQEAETGNNSFVGGDNYGEADDKNNDYKA